MLIQIHLIRHAKTQGNLEHRYIGSTDEPICESGRAELEMGIVAGKYPACEALFISPLQRCQETAAMIYPATLPWVEEGLRECDFGAFEGKNYQELKDDAAYQQLLDRNGIGQFPQGEDSELFRARSCAAFERIVATVMRERRKTVSIVCHGGTIMALMSRYCEDAGAFFDYQTPNCGGYSVVLDCDKMKFVSYQKL